jgi:hypothetical protein
MHDAEYPAVDGTLVKAEVRLESRRPRIWLATESSFK